MATGLLFSGQGAQTVGMGKSLYDNSPAARAIYDEADAVLGWKLTEISFNGPQAALTETKVCQPALYVHGVAVVAALREAGKLPAIGAALGLSLGELTAYHVAGVFDFATGLRVVAERGRLMQMACDMTKGTMAAVIGGDREQAAKLCQAFDIDMANLNAPGQIIISGEVDKVNAAAAVAKDYGFKMAKVLDVAGAYHSRLMEPARAAFEAFLKDIPFSAPKVPVFTNVTGLRVSDPAEMKRMLVRQVVSSVLWEDDMRSAVALGMGDFLECGIGGVLAGIAKRTDKAWNVRSISEHADITAL